MSEESKEMQLQRVARAICDAGRETTNHFDSLNEGIEKESYREEARAAIAAMKVAPEPPSREEILAALKDLLLHAGIADAAPDDIDGIDHQREHRARAIIARASKRGD